MDIGRNDEFECILAREDAIPDAPPAHIDMEALRFYLRRLGFDTTNDPQPDREDDLRNRDVLTEIGGELRATLYGVLAFARDPQRYQRNKFVRVSFLLESRARSRGGDRDLGECGAEDTQRQALPHVQRDRAGLPEVARSAITLTLQAPDERPNPRI